MYFLNEDHAENFDRLKFLYSPYKSNDRQYLANMYIAAVPEIFKLLRINDALISNGPLVSLMKYSEKEDRLIPNNAALTTSSKKLLSIGMSLHNGYECDLDYTPSGGYGQVILQAIAIRYHLTVEIK